VRLWQLVLDVIADFPQAGRERARLVRYAHALGEESWAMAVAPTHFERLGLPRRFDLDAAEIERNYLARSREVHPDYHQQSSPAEQRLSMEMSAVLNEAYATLKQPFRRAEYLLALEGGPTASEKEMAAAFLEEMLELRMEIEELREGPADSPRRRDLEAKLNQRTADLVGDLGRWFTKLDGLLPGDGKRREALLQVRQLLNAARYNQGLLRDLRAD
jgi:molecular chaperone HscB